MYQVLKYRLVFKKEIGLRFFTSILGVYMPTFDLELRMGDVFSPGGVDLLFERQVKKDTLEFKRFSLGGSRWNEGKLSFLKVGYLKICGIIKNSPSSFSFVISLVTCSPSLSVFPINGRMEGYSLFRAIVGLRHCRKVTPEPFLRAHQLSWMH